MLVIVVGFVWYPPIFVPLQCLCVDILFSYYIPVVEVASPQVLTISPSMSLTSTDITPSRRYRTILGLFLITPHTQWVGGSPLFHESSYNTSPMPGLTRCMSPSIGPSSSLQTPSMNITSPSLLELPKILVAFTLLQI